MADIRDLEGIDRFVRALLADSASRRRVLAVLQRPTSVEERALALRADLRLLRGSVSLPRLTHGNAVTLVRAFDVIRARSPQVIDALDADSLPRLESPLDQIAFFS